MTITLVVMWFAVVAGIVEALALYTRRFIFGRLTWTSVEVIWMAPAANALILAAPALALAMLGLWWFPPVMRRVLPAALTGFTIWGILIVLAAGALHPLALVLLSVGCAVQCYRVLGGRVERFEWTAVRSFPMFAGLLLLLAISMRATSAISERRALAHASARAGAPNVLLVILDTVRAASLSLYGSARPTTPNLERRAGTGVVFDFAFTPAPWSLPAHGSIFTGHWPHDVSRGWKQPLDIKGPTLTEVIRERGYVTAGFTANYYYTTRESGFVRGFMHYEDLRTDLLQVLRSSILGQILSEVHRRGSYTYQPVRVTHEKNADEIVASFLNWLPRAGDRPWFVFLNFFDAHRPFSPPKPWSDSLTRASRSVDRYDQEILYVDAQLGRLLDSLDTEGRLENTLVVIAGDHGELLGAHRIHGHGNSLFRRVLRVPLMLLYGDRIPAGRRISQPVSTRDIAATILDLIGTDTPGIEGTTLARTWEGGLAYGGPVLAELDGSDDPKKGLAIFGPMFSVVGPRYQYIRRGDGREHLYDIRQDSLEIWNLRDSTAQHDDLQRLRELGLRLTAGFYTP